ncbi:MAG: hypothetical protein ACPL3Q_05535 [Candidatus Ratteibacteria bacterium]
MSSFITDTANQYGQLTDELIKLINNDDTPFEIKVKAGLMLCLSYIFQNNLASACSVILKVVPSMEKAVPQGQDPTIFTRVKSVIEKGTIKDISVLMQTPEFNADARQIAERINLLIESRENYKKSIEMCAQKYRPILKASLDDLIRENNLQGAEAESLRKKLEQKYLDKIERDGYFLIYELKQDFSQYLFEKLFSN